MLKILPLSEMLSEKRDNTSDERRLFFGLEVQAPWPPSFPDGRLLQEANRHMTVAFLGNVDYPLLIQQLKTTPPSFIDRGLVGKFNKCLFLPPKHPNVIAWQVQWLEEDRDFYHILEEFIGWLQQHQFIKNEKERSLLPHVTIARTPFNTKEWNTAFHEIPMKITNFNLYESIGNLTYEPRWRFPLTPPFIEIEHTTGIAFHIYGSSIQHLYQHAQVALAFKYPPLLAFLKPYQKVENLDELIIALNTLISEADSIAGCPFKAVSFHDKMTETNRQLKWEMIVDV